ncbi:hypothetical protein BGE01nite_09290 [Brevifollis gellanilyticus]|uniref:Uncharacterized protein n=2 Tax=Brevifollis gellanilyticus TaxID=748831 RepID=A0A512M4J7_9BACT|nr:hypothetical protein BGE01nite_09290 [Brevifollis gellanilyticus]
MGFVVVQHLSPAHVSSLTEILARETTMPVCEVSDEPRVEPNHVYIIPPGRDMTIAKGSLALLPQERAGLRRGIDQFFQSLAEDRQHKAIGVVLSGGANDGTQGIEEIKAAGGMTFAQDESALHGSMPQSAVASGCVDFVLSPEDIAAEIARIARHPYVAPADRDDAPTGSERARIVQIVQRATGMDFTHYKANTMQRRISRRMMMHKLETIREYVDYLRRQPAEVQALYQDLLIGVTSFFRNPDAFEVLARTVFTRLLKNRKSDDPVRIWVLGCSTGEEAYSLAIAFTECAEAARSHVPLQIFATDTNAKSIDKARTGFYPRSIAADVSPARLARFFVEEERGYRISRIIRERCIFSRHNALTDPPFSRLDLVSCRNMLIYLEPVLQQRIMPMLHYALNPEGGLWLGSSETVGSYRTLFELEDVRQKIFVRLPGPPAARFSTQVPDRLPNKAHAPPTMPPREPEQVTLQRRVERLLLAKYAPPAVVITEGMEIIQFCGDTGDYLSPAAGTPTQSLLKMLREGLQVGVRAAIQRAILEKGTVRETGLRVRGSEGYREIAVEVMPLQAGTADQAAFVVMFDDGARPLRHEPPPPPPPTGSEAEEIIRLTHELASTREYLQSVIEQQEAANEELQSANEEAQSTNEEAQSTNEEMQSINEELETTKEEIQSSNEELSTINEELTARTQEMQVARDYAESIVASVRVPLLVLNGELRVKSASRAFYELFQVTPELTIGRCLYDLGNGQWNILELRRLLESILPGQTLLKDFAVSHTFDVIGLRHMLVSSCRLVQARGHEPLILLSVEDVTERREVEDALAARMDDLDKADRSKDEFLAMLAHELRNPLAPLRNAFEILQLADLSSKEHDNAQRMIGRQIDNMSRMIEDLLDVSRITEGKIELRRQPVSLESILTGATSIVRSACARHSQNLSVLMPKVPVYLDADATRLEQVFSNLLGNACKYSGDGSNITLSAERAEGVDPPEVVITVRDDGIGIAPDLLPRIFDLFVQSSRTLDRTHGGLGIGLTLVKRLIALHDGNVEAHSQGLGYGSEFIVHLPILREAPPPPPALKVRAPREPPRRILIVDDNTDSAQSLSTLQRRRGHDTCTAFTGPDALTAAIAFTPKVVLLDIGLPGMDGFEVARRLRAMPALEGVLLLAMSGYGSPEDRRQAKEAGFDDYLVRPVDLEQLSRLLREAPGGNNNE